MLTIYHLGVSQSDRIVWLMEELGLPYELEWFDRGPDGLAPPEYLALHPCGTAPVVKDGDQTLTESAVILEYISHCFALVFFFRTYETYEIVVLCWVSLCVT